MMTVNVKDALGSTGFGFALSYAFLRFILVAEYLRIWRHVPEARSLSKRYVAGFGAAAMRFPIKTSPHHFRVILI